MRFPIFLDIEASGLSIQSFPIEIAWNFPSGEIESHLINPEFYPHDYSDWNDQAVQLHGLTRQFLKKNGSHPAVIANRLNEILAGLTVYSDHVSHDSFWIDQLFKAVNMRRIFQFVDVDCMLQDFLSPQLFLYDKNSKCFPITKIKDDARQQCGLAPHRASHDVAYLKNLYQLSRQIS